MIKLENVSYVYMQGGPFEKTALNNINLEIGDGEFIGLIGHTGSGKSTLIQLLNGLIKPTEGRVRVAGFDLTDKKTKMRDVRFKVGLVMQYPEHQLFEETVFKDIAFGPQNMGLPQEEIKNRVEFAANLVGLSKEILDKSPFDLSGGQKRRVAIAGVMAMSPKVLVLDEPAAGLDPKGRDEILARIREYHQETKSTVLLVSHSMEDIAKNAHSIIVMNRAKCMMHASVKEVFEKAEELEKIGLDIPQITKVFISLNKLGYKVSSDIYTVDDARDEILRCLKGGDIR